MNNYSRTKVILTSFDVCSSRPAGWAKTIRRTEAGYGTDDDSVSLETRELKL